MTTCLSNRREDRLKRRATSDDVSVKQKRDRFNRRATSDDVSVKQKKGQAQKKSDQ